MILSHAPAVSFLITSLIFTTTAAWAQPNHCENISGIENIVREIQATDHDIIKPLLAPSQTEVFKKLEKRLLEGPYFRDATEKEGLHFLLRHIHSKFEQLKDKHSEEPLLEEIREVHNGKLLTSRVWKMPTGEIIFDFPGVKLGEGASKKVILGVNLSNFMSNHPLDLIANFEVELGSIRDKPAAIRRFRDEIALANKFTKDPNKISRLWRRDDTIFASQSIFELGDLLNFRSSSTFGGSHNQEAQRAKIGLDLIRNLELIHSQGYFHGDLKSANVLLKKENGRSSAHISDFGTTRKVEEVLKEATATEGEINDDGVKQGYFYSTAGYLAPEHGKAMALISSHPHQVKAIAQGADVWAMGMTLYDLKLTEGLGGCSKKNDLSPHRTAIKMSTVKSYDDLCKTCGIFCSTDPDKKGKSHEPAAGTQDHVIYQMLNPKYEERISTHDALIEIEKVNSH